MHALSTVSLLDALQGSHTLASIPPNAVVGVYFAKTGHGACQQFTKTLVTLTQALDAASGAVPFVVIVVSVDQEQTQFASWTSELPCASTGVTAWRIVPFPEVNTRKQLIEALGVTQVPSLFLRNSDGHVLTPRGKELVEKDPLGTKFPWTNGRVEMPRDHLTYSAATCVRIAVKQLGLKTLRHHEAKQVSDQGLQAINEAIRRADALVDELFADNEVDADSVDSQSLFDEKLSFASHTNMHLLQIVGREDQYAGETSDTEIPILGSFLDVPAGVSSIQLAVAAFVRCHALCESLLRRAADGSSSSRVALHHQVIQLLTALFIDVLPPPKPRDQRATCIWSQSVSQQLQLKCLDHVHSLLMLLGSVWQSMEQPSRQFDSERALAALCGLAIFDAVLRTPALDNPMAISLLMEGGDGSDGQPAQSTSGIYVLAHRFCKANRSLQQTTAAMEFIRPSTCVTRSHVLAYFASQDAAVSSPSHAALFDYPMPDDKIELKKYSTTLLFFRRLMETYHYPLIDVNDPNPPTEMEALLDWFCGDDSTMSREHREVALARDVVVLVKFLVTMETKDVELMRRRVTPHPWQSMWQLSFDEDATSSSRRRQFFGMRGLDRVLHGVLKWEVVNIRGSDQDTADIDVVGFMERKLFFGEGPVVVSPTDLGALLLESSNSSVASAGNVVTEDDIMHLDRLPSFQGTLSSEEAEYLLSYLTVPYARIPLIVTFFASRDRVTYLFNPSLQQLFRTVLFETGDWVSPSTTPVEITHVPLRKSNLLLREEAVARVLDARVTHQRCEDHLGTSYGLLLNELQHAPEAVLNPLLKMLVSIEELGEASVHSADASFILFMIKVGMDTLRYTTFALAMLEQDASSSAATRDALREYREKLLAYAFGFAWQTLEKWRREAESRHDLADIMCHPFVFSALERSAATVGVQC
ncbi:hypothetical protein PINS_up011750 [Pythium insidiosum]|nr:hypothetical protein PINS_up011750 [Pythium insidiosum]